MAFDRTDAADLVVLKSEVLTDPTGLGYDPAGNTQVLLGLINTANPATTLPKPKVSSALIRSATTYDAYDTLAIDEQEWLRWVTGSNGVDEENITVSVDFSLQLTGNGNPNNSFWAVAHRDEMVAAMFTIFNRPASRAEILWGLNTSISRDDWFAARDS